MAAMLYGVKTKAGLLPPTLPSGKRCVVAIRQGVSGSVILAKETDDHLILAAEVASYLNLSDAKRSLSVANRYPKYHPLAKKFRNSHGVAIIRPVTEFSRNPSLSRDGLKIHAIKVTLGIKGELKTGRSYTLPIRYPRDAFTRKRRPYIATYNNRGGRIVVYELIDLNEVTKLVLIANSNLTKKRLDLLEVE